VTDIGKIITQLEVQKAAIERAISALRAVGASGRGKGSAAPGVKAGRRRSRLSPEGRRRIAEAARRRWAAKRAADANKKAAKK
jgi:hypothetical protein